MPTELHTQTELLQALIKAKLEIGGVKKDADNPFTKSKYATLTAVLEAAEPALLKHGLVITQHVVLNSDREVGGQHLRTVLQHAETGQSLESDYELRPAKNDPQGWGAALTYARRYSVLALLSLSVEDDDGESAMARGSAAAPRAALPRRTPSARPAPTPPPPPAVLAQEKNNDLAGGDVGDNVYATKEDALAAADSAENLPHLRNWWNKVVRSNFHGSDLQELSDKKDDCKERLSRQYQNR